jgi:hypothetical protein
MKRLVLLLLLMLGATRLVARPARSGESPGTRPEVAATGVAPPRNGSSASSVEPSAEAAPPRWFRDARPAPSFQGVLTGLQAIKGGLAITPERAEGDARKQFEQAVADWLARDGVPRDWTVPAPLLDRLVRARHTAPVLRDDLGPELDDYKVWYETAYQAEFSPALKAEILAAYERDVVRGRLGLLAGVVAFVLACLAALAGYIRADEATKGYYTNRLRLVAAAGVGAAGVAIYRLLS